MSAEFLKEVTCHEEKRTTCLEHLNVPGMSHTLLTIVPTVAL